MDKHLVLTKANSADQEKTEGKLLLKNSTFEPSTVDCTPALKEEKFDNKLSSLFMLNPEQTCIKQELYEEENASKISSEETGKLTLKQNISKLKKRFKISTQKRLSVIPH